MSVVINHPTGNEFFRAAINGFYEAGNLQSIYTTLASFPGTLMYKLGALKGLHDIKRRALDKRFQPITHTHPMKEAARLLSIKLKQQKLIRHETGMFSVDAVYKNLDKHVAGKLKLEQAKGANIIYAYEDGAAYSFEKAKALNMKRIYDLPIGYWQTMRKLLSAEKELNPEWANTLDGFKDSAEKLIRKDEEISLADNVIVASSFTARSLEIYKETLPVINLVPYGFPPVYTKTYRYIKSNNRIKFLFVGGLSQRKGLSYLFEAIKEFKSSVSLTIIGRGNIKNSKVLADNLAKHTWIETLSHKEVLKQMHLHDVLIFPSLFEGFGQVITEAMAQGTPVITTERTAGPDIITHGENGWIINAGSVNAIKNILQEIIQYPEMIEAAGKNAIKAAAKRPWSEYEKDLTKTVTDNVSTVN